MALPTIRLSVTAGVRVVVAVVVVVVEVVVVVAETLPKT
jgi:hypothetical protein